MKIRTFILLLFLSFAHKPGAAQTGYQGRCNELSIDIFNLANQGELNLMYKRAVSKNILLFINYLHADFRRAMESPQVYDLHYTSASTQISYNYDDVISGESMFKMTTYGFGLLKTSNEINMNMPVGIYSGIGIYISNGELSDVYNLKSGLPGSGIPIKYEVSQFNLRAIYGADFVITGMLTLDISLAAGFTSGTYKLLNTYGSGIASDSPFGTYPQIIFTGHSRVDDWRRDESSASGTYSKMSFFVSPSIRIGYIF